jgi:hypothetical protein
LATDGFNPDGTAMAETREHRFQVKTQLLGARRR